MAAGRAQGKPDKGYAGRKGGRDIAYNHRFVVGASGAVSSQDSLQDSGLQAFVKTGTAGRYTITLSDRPRQLRRGTATIIGPDTAAYGAVSAALPCIWRDDDLATDGTIEIQFVNASTNWTDADLPSGTIVILDFSVRT